MIDMREPQPLTLPDKLTPSQRELLADATKYWSDTERKLFVLAGKLEHKEGKEEYKSSSPPRAIGGNSTQQK